MTEYEKAVLQSLMLEQSDWMFGRVKPDYFIDEKAKELFGYIVEQNKNGLPIDFVLVAKDLQKRGLLETFREARESEAIPTLFDVYVGELRKAYVEREMLRILNASLADGFISEVAMKSLRAMIEQAEASYTSPGTSLAERLPAVLEQIEQDFGKGPEFSFGIAKLDEIVWGVHREELTVIAAYAGIGKTTFLTNSALNFSAGGREALFFCTEISEDQFIKLRLLPLAAQVEATAIRKNLIGPGDKETWRKLTAAASELSAHRLYVNGQSSPTLADIGHAIRTLKPGVVIVDYLGQCKLPRGESHRLQVGELAKGLKNMARNEKVAMVVAVQLNRESQQTLSPMLSQLSDSAGIERAADAVILLHHADPALDCIEVICAKTRWSRRGICYIHRDPASLAFTPCPVPGGCAKLEGTQEPGRRRAGRTL